MIVVIASTLIILFVVYKLIQYDNEMVLAFPILYVMVTQTVSVIYLETSPSWISETNVYSSNIGASFRLIIYNAIIILGIITGKFMMPENINVGDRIMVKSADVSLWGGVVSILLLFQILNVVFSGAAFSGDRYDLWNHVPFQMLESIIGVLVIFVPFYAGYVLAVASQRKLKLMRLFSVTLLGLYAFYLFASSQSFHGFLIGTLMFVMPYLIVEKRTGVSVSTRDLFIIGLAIACILAFTVDSLASRKIAKATNSDIFEILKYRVLVMQGGVYFTIDLLTQNNPFQSIRLLFSDMTSFIDAFLSPQQAYEYKARGVNLAGSFPGTAVAVFGYYNAAPVLFVFGIFNGLIMRFVKKMLFSGHPIIVIFIAYIWLWTSTCYVRGSLHEVVSIKYIVFFVLVISIYQLQKINKY